MAGCGAARGEGPDLHCVDDVLLTPCRCTRRFLGIRRDVFPNNAVSSSDIASCQNGMGARVDDRSSSRIRTRLIHANTRGSSI